MAQITVKITRGKFPGSSEVDVEPAGTYRFVYDDEELFEYLHDLEFKAKLKGDTIKIVYD